MSYSTSYGTGCTLQTKLQERAEVLLEVRNVKRQEIQKELGLIGHHHSICVANSKPIPSDFFKNEWFIL